MKADKKRKWQEYQNIGAQKSEKTEAQSKIILPILKSIRKCIATKRLLLCSSQTCFKITTHLRKICMKPTAPLKSCRIPGDSFYMLY